LHSTPIAAIIPSLDRLPPRWMGPFPLAKTAPKTYRLDDPSSWRAFSEFNVERPRRYLCRPPLSWRAKQRNPGTSSGPGHRRRTKASGEALLKFSMRANRVMIFVYVQPYSTTLFGVPFPFPTPQGAGIGNSGRCPRPRFEGCAWQPSGQEAHSANLFRKECQGCSEARKPSCPATQIQSSEAILTSRPWFAAARLTGGYARWLIVHLVAIFGPGMVLMLSVIQWSLLRTH
jgi:hypothetical protein